MEHDPLLRRAARVLAAPVRRIAPKVVDAVLEGAARVLVRGHPTNTSGNNMSQR